MKDCHLIPVGHDYCIWSCRLRCYCLLELIVVTVSCLMFHFRVAILFLICYSISYLPFHFLLFALYLLWCEERSETVVGIGICCLVPRLMICSLITFSYISFQRDELLLLDPWLIHCLFFRMNDLGFKVFCCWFLLIRVWCSDSFNYSFLPIYFVVHLCWLIAIVFFKEFS